MIGDCIDMSVKRYICKAFQHRIQKKRKKKTEPRRKIYKTEERMEGKEERRKWMQSKTNTMEIAGK